MIYDQQLKITFRKFSGPPEKIAPPFLLIPPLKIQKVQVSLTMAMRLMPEIKVILNIPLK